MKTWNKLMVFSGIVILASCTGEHATDSLRAYVADPDHGLTKKITVDQVEFLIQYQPAEYIQAREGKASGRQLDSMAWFHVGIRVVGSGASPLRYRARNQAVLEARLQYYLSDASRDIFLRYGDDTLAVSSYWFEYNQNLTDFETMIVGFHLKDDKVASKDMQFVFYDRVFGSGIIKTRFLKEAVAQVRSVGLNH